MFQQFTYQRKSTPYGIKKKSDKGSDLDGEGARNRTTKGFDNESNVIAIADTLESSPVRTMDDKDSLSDEELLRSTFDSTENEEKPLGPEYWENQINSSPSKCIQKLDKMGCKVENGNGKVDEKENSTGSEEKNLENSKPKYSDQESYNSKSSSNENTKKKRKRFRSFNDSDSDVHSTPQKKQKEAMEIEIISYTKRDDSYHSPRKFTDEKVKMLKEMFPNRSDVEILEAMKVTDNVPQAAVMLSNRAWTPIKGRSKTDSKDPEIIEIIDDEDDVDEKSDDGNNDNEDVDEDDSKDKDGLRNSEKATILTFLNSCSLDDLLIVFSEKKANKLLQLRPFESWLDLKAKLNSSRGLTDKAVHKCRSFLNTRAQVVHFMERCEKISKDIQQLLPDCLNGQIPNGMTQPGILNPSCKLKPYQLAGLHWLKLMHWKKMNCILADEMGLGKTIQALSFIAHLIEEGDDGPYLIVVPTSTVDNWVRELKHWCPTIQYVQYIGNMEERIYLREDIKSQDCQVIITTYQMVCSTADDRKLFRNLKIHYVIFDEGHMLKNMQTQRYQKLFRINAKRRLLLTGTPLQNNLLELMSLLHFVMPQMFGGISEELQMIFTGKGVENYAKERVYQAKSIMKPFVLRRLKKDVLDQLPSKTEEIVMVDLTDRQRELYDRVFKECYEEYKFKKGGIYSGKIRNLVMPLRLTSNHPLLLRNNYTDSKLQDMAARYCRDISNRGSDVDLVHEDMTVMSDFELHHLCLGQNNLTSYALEQDVLLDSGKFNYLAKTLPDMKEKGDRVLLFSQFRLVMDIIEEFLKYHKYSFLRLDGNTKIGERQNLIDQFNSENDIFIFLLSTKAGGLGINLTSANVVIIHDIDFNPYNDKQAEDRCHRVGQTRDVHVYKLVSRNTIEEAILKRAKCKLKLEEDVVSSKDDEESEDDVATVLSQTFG